MLPFTEPLTAARRAHCDLLAASGIAGIGGSCLYGAIVLQMMVDLFRGEPCTVIRGGDGAADGAFVDTRGRAHGHYWVEAMAEDGSVYVLDITADQFGDDALVQVPLAVASRYRPGDQDLVDQHVRGEIDKMHAEASQGESRP